MMLNKLGLAAVSAVVAAGAAQASPFADGSFETVLTPPGSYVPYSAGASLGPWVVSQGQIDLMNHTAWNPDFHASDGINSIDMNGSNGTLGGIAQIFDTIAGATYTVSFDMNANVYDYFKGIKTIRVEVAAFSQEFGYDTNLHPIGQGGPWTTHSFSFVALGTSSTLNFVSTYVGGGNVYGALLDNVIVSHVDANAVPEPASWALMVAGIGAAGAFMRRAARAKTALA